MSKNIFRKYELNDAPLWDEFIQNSINGTIFSERKFLSYHPENRFNDHSLLIYHNDKLIAIFAAAIIERDKKRIIKSHPGASYGGFIFADHLELKSIFEIIEEFEKYCIKQNINTIEFRHSPNIFRINTLDSLDFALVRNNYLREDEEISTYFNLDGLNKLNEDQILYTYKINGYSKSRQHIKKSLNSELIYAETDNINDFKKAHDIISDNLKKHNANPVHSKDELIKLNNLYPDRVKLIVAKKEDKIIGILLLININKNGWHIFYAALDYEYSKYKPIHFLIFKTKIQLAKENYKYLNYGISTEDGGRYINWNLLQFKEGFNGLGTVRTYWKKELNV